MKEFDHNVLNIDYIDKELYRLNTAASPIKDAYQPLIPILWNTM